MSISNSADTQEYYPPNMRRRMSPEEPPRVESRNQPGVRFSMRLKLTIAFVGIVLTSITVVSFFVINTTRTALTEAANQQLLASAQQISTQIDDYLLANQTAMEAEAQLPYFRRFVSLPEESRTSREIINIKSSLIALKDRDPYILSYTLMDRTGDILVESRELAVDIMPDFLGVDSTIQSSLESAMFTNSFYISPIRYDPELGESIFYFAAPIRDLTTRPAGILVARYRAAVFQDFLAQNNELVGPGSYGALYARTYDNYLHLAHGTSPDLITKSVAPMTDEQIQEMKARNQILDLPPEELSINLPDLLDNLTNAYLETFFTLDVNNQTQQVAVIQLEEKPWLLAFYVPQEVFLAPVAEQTTLIILLAVIVGAATLVIAALVARGFSNPIINLAEMANQVEEGNLDARSDIRSSDEIGLLASSFNGMTSRLQNTLNTLEERIAQRTESLARRAVQLQTSAELARDATTIRDRDRLLNQITHLISDRFGFYHAGVFLIEPTGTYAVLEAANSEGGQIMLARGHRLEVGQVGIVGYVAATGDARIALDVGEDAVFFDNPDLPDTRSEIALPLLIENEVIGVLDVQSRVEQAFTNEDIEILQVLADQVAVALDNARLLEQSQSALREIEVLYGHQIQQNWQAFLAEQPSAFEYVAGQVAPLVKGDNGDHVLSLPEEAVMDGNRMVVPISIRDQKIGSFTLERREDDPLWNEEDLELVQQTMNQMGVILETTRLLEQTQAQAIQEQLTTRISTELRQTLDMDTILQTAARTLGDTFNLNSVRVQMAAPHNDHDPGDEENR